MTFAIVLYAVIAIATSLTWNRWTYERTGEIKPGLFVMRLVPNALHRNVVASALWLPFTIVGLVYMWRKKIRIPD